MFITFALLVLPPISETGETEKITIECQPRRQPIFWYILRTGSIRVPITRENPCGRMVSTYWLPSAIFKKPLILCDVHRVTRLSYGKGQTVKIYVCGGAVCTRNQPAPLWMDSHQMSMAKGHNSHSMVTSKWFGW